MVKVNINNLHGNDAVHSAKSERADVPAKSIPTKDLKASLGRDKVEFSGRGAEVGKLTDQVKSLPDIRQDRVSELKQKIASGEYNPSSGDIADAIMKDEK